MHVIGVYVNVVDALFIKTLFVINLSLKGAQSFY